MEELQTTPTDAPAGAGDVSSEIVSQLNEIAGRDFKDVDDFKKHYQNLNSFVGEKNEAKEKLSALLAKAKPYADAYGVQPDEFLETYLENPNITTDDLKSTLSSKQELRKQEEATVQNKQTVSKLERLEFQVSNPDLKDQMELIETLAKGKGITLADAAKDPLVKKAVELTREQKGNSIIQTNQKVANTDSDLARKRQAVSSGKTDALAEYLRATGVGNEIE